MSAPSFRKYKGSSGEWYLSNLSYLESLRPREAIRKLLNLSVHDILQICDRSNRLRSICDNWDFWAEKAEMDFGIPFDVFADTDLEDPSERYQELEEEGSIYPSYGGIAEYTNYDGLGTTS